ncbi:SNARE domain-containing protein [Halenospora varia]|nr:SNARE domain-containing protein [Halenospora varia]
MTSRYGRQNPYDQRGGNSPAQGGFNSPGYGAPAMGRDDYGGTLNSSKQRATTGTDILGGQNVEMASLTQNGSQFGQNPNAILDECQEIDRAVAKVEQEDLRDLKSLQQKLLNNPDQNTNDQERLDQMASEIMTTYRSLVKRVKLIKSQPESGSPKNAPNVGRLDRKLKLAIGTYQKVDAEYHKKLQEQMARQYRIVRPDASEAEVREAVEDTSQQQVFSQALLQGDRRGQSQSALRAVQSRHDEIQKIERQMIELAELFQDMENLVVQQEVAVTNIEMKGEEVVENMDKGNEQIGVAIKSAKNARKWKWWCLGITLLIIAIIVIVVLIYKFVVLDGAKKATGQAKRFVLPGVEHRVISGQEWSPPTNKIMIPGVDFDPSSKPVVPGAEWQPNSRKARSFQA